MEKISINITGMHCSSCAAAVEGLLKGIDGVKRVNVNFASGKAFIELEPGITSVQELEKVIVKAGYGIPEADELGLGVQEKRRLREIKDLKIRFFCSLGLSLPLMYISMSEHFDLFLPVLIEQNLAITQFLLATPVMFLGRQFFIRGISSVIRAKAATMDTLVSLGVGSAYIYSLCFSIADWADLKIMYRGAFYYEIAAFLITFILLGRLLEASARGRVSEAIRKLLGLRPRTAIIERNGAEKEVRVEEVAIGDIVIVRPGERVPADGVLTDGHSSVDESMISGESIPVEKTAGSEVIAATINKTGAFKFRATKVGKDTVLAQIIKLVEEAQGSKAPIQELADRTASFFVPVVLLIAVVTFLFWLFIGKGVAFALTACIAVLIIACPCSLGLATPTAIMVATAIGADFGILIRNARSLELARKVKWVVFDKTGTLTKGKPSLSDIVCIKSSDEKEVLKLAAVAEKRSEHALAEAITEAAKQAGIQVPEADAFNALTGKGVIARIKGEIILLGNRKLFSDRKIDISYVEEKFSSLEKQGKTVVAVAFKDEILGLIAVSDKLKEFSRPAVDTLKALGKEVVLITGDNHNTALAIAKEAGIDKCLSEVLPQDKAFEIKKIQDKGGKVAMVGDGINDAPALAQADVGIALGAGTDVAIESADMVLIKDDLRDVAIAMDLSRYCMKKIKQNLFWAFSYNLLGIPIAAGVFFPLTGILLSPIIAGAAMAFSSVSVVTNSLLMRNYKKPV